MKIAMFHDSAFVGYELRKELPRRGFEVKQFNSGVVYQTTITTFDNDVAKATERDAPPPKGRYLLALKLYNVGIRTVCRIDPIIPNVKSITLKKTVELAAQHEFDERG